MSEQQVVEQTMELKNYDDRREKSIWDDDGRRDSLGPLERRRMTYEKARLFLDKHHRYVREYEEVLMPVASPGERIIYVANITGSRLLPRKIVLSEMKDNQRIETEIPNPLCLPDVKTFRLQGALKITGGDGDRKSFKHPAYQVILEPLKRYPLPEGVATTILQRDSRAPDIRKGSIVMVEPPVDFEPNETWPLDDLRLYAPMIDPDYFNKDVLTREFPSEASFKVDKGVDHDGLAKTKRALVAALFPCLIDDRYSKPSQEAFNAIKRKTRK